MEVRSMLATIIVNFVLTSAQSPDQFQNLFDSIARNDRKNNQAYGAYRDIVKENVEVDRDAFDMMKEELRLIRIGNIRKRKNLYEQSNFGEKVRHTKRETKETKRRRGRLNITDSTEKAVTKKVAKKVVNKTLDLAVLPMAGFEKYYFEVSPLNLERPAKILIKNEKTGDKKLTCDTIFSNPVMIDTEGADTVDPMDKQIQDELQAKRPDIYERFYKAPNVMVLNQVYPQFLNSYRKYNFTIRGVTTQEAAFPCLARKRSTGNIEEYLVSQTYILPLSETPPDIKRNERKFGPLVAARFVILRDATNDTTLIAMTDRALEEVRPVNPRFCERTELTTPGRSKELCEIPEIQQIRLCAILFNSRNYSQLFQYAASSTPPGCRESKLSVRCEEEGSLEYTDTVLDCQVTRTGTGSKQTVSYYISRSFKPYQFLVATLEEGSAVPVVKDVFFSYAIKLVQPEVPDLPIG